MTPAAGPDESPADVVRLIAQSAASPDLPEDAPHILLAVDQLMATLGGGERALWRLAARLPDYGFRVSILTLAVDSRSPILQDPPCPVYVLPLQRTWDFSALRAALALRRFLKEQRVWLVQTYFESSDLWVGGVAKTVSGVRLIWSRRDMGILRGAKHRVAYRMLARMPDFVFAVSEQVRRYCIEVDGIRPERVRTIYNGVALEPSVLQNKENRLEIQPPRVLCVGNIRRVKGHDVLVEAATLVRDKFPEAEFAIAGEPAKADYFALLQKRVEQLGLSARFHFLGGVSALDGELARATMFVMPSRSEGFSNAIVEAMAASLPVVATAVGGNGEAVEDEATGLLVPSDDARALAEAICRLLKNPQLASEMGAAGRERALRLFTEAQTLGTTAEIYRKLLNS